MSPHESPVSFYSIHQLNKVKQSNATRKRTETATSKTARYVIFKSTNYFADLDFSRRQLI